VVPITVTNASGTEGAAELAAAMLGAEGFPPDVVVVSDREAAGVTEGEAAPSQTKIFCHPSVEGFARSVRARIFPTAEIQGRIDPDSIVVAVGDDFVQQNPAMLANFMMVHRFMTHRAEGGGAEAFLSDDAAREYAEGVGGLDLYAYTQGMRFQVTALRPGEDESAVAVVRIDAPSTGYETLTVGDHDPADGTLEILAAELNEVPVDISGPAAEEVQAFVEQFLEARRGRSGAGTYLGEDARAAYASHEEGLDLLGYAASNDLVRARVVGYDKHSPHRHRVVVGFRLRSSDGPSTVWETLLIGWRGGDVFVVLDAERGPSDQAGPG
jgi:hypothetical protein